VRPVCGAVVEELIGFENIESTSVLLSSIAYEVMVGREEFMFSLMEAVIRKSLDVLDASQGAISRSCIEDIPLFKAGRVRGDISHPHMGYCS